MIEVQSLYQQWNDMNAFKNQMVNIISANHTKAGKCLGIDETGALLLKCPDSSTQRIFGGEVSLRKQG